MTRMLKADSAIGRTTDLSSTQSIVDQAQQIEADGFDGAMFTETSHDPFLPISLAAHVTDKLQLRTAIAVAFARSPMNVACIANDLHHYSRGRFTLGLGSQIKPHITKRFSMPWHGPAKQMREFIEAIRAIWDSWHDGVPLKYEGAFYKHTLMTPEFTPDTLDYGRPKIVMSAVGPLMMKTAAAVADGVIIHPFNTEAYLRQTTLPAIAAERAAQGKDMDDFEIQYPVFIAQGETEEALEEAKNAVRYRIGFYSSTPAYRGVLEANGWGDFQTHMNILTKQGEWDKLAGEVTDEMLHSFAAVGTPEECAQIVKDRYGDVISRITLEPSAKLDAQLAILRG